MSAAFSALLGQTPPPQAAMLKPLAAPSIGAKTTPDQLKKLAGDFESSFISSLLQPMFDTLSTDGPFGGGQGEAAFKSFLTDAMGKQMSKAGGLGLSGALQKEFLRMQGAKQ